MHKHLRFAAALSLLASTCFAGAGIDLSLVSCPGNPGAVGVDVGNVDCSGNVHLVVLGTWAPAEDIPDLVALDGVLDAQVSDNLDINRFWNFDASGCNFQHLKSSHVLPATGCSTPNAYTDTWDLPGSGSEVAAFRRGSAYERLAITVFRPGAMSITAQQRMFGMQIVIDAPGGGGDACPGCPASFCLRWTEGSPRSANEASPTDLFLSTGDFPGFDNTLRFNNASGLLCDFATPAKKRTWGQLKSLYR